ncbi:MAG TPA: hypothetical protein VJ723_11475 [Candidatus Angelobacter sp.]|nr:hypothetical protein [Candidatus Angelobacter sp.]
MEIVVLAVLLFFVMLAAVLFVRSARALFEGVAEMERWQGMCCLVGLVFGSLGWFTIIAIVVCVVLAKGDFLMDLSIFGSVATPVALVLGLTSSVKPGHLVAKAAAAQGVFWLALWVLTPRGV